MKRALGLLAALCITGCASMSTSLRPPEYYANVAEQGLGEASLFGSDSAVLGDADITRILAYDYSPPPLGRIALLPFGWSSWASWSEEMAVATQQVNEQVLATLRTSPKIYDASFLPSILIPEKRTVPYLREAAARYQADLLATQSYDTTPAETDLDFGETVMRSQLTAGASALAEVADSVVQFLGQPVASN